MLKEKDKIITSKGRFGVIKELVNEEKSLVTIGNKDYFILNSELIKCDNLKSLEVEYHLSVINPSLPLKAVVYIERKITLFDVKNPLSNHLISICKKELEKQLNTNSTILITKIHLV